MIWTVTLLGLLASASARDWLPGLKARYDINPLTWSRSSFYGLPRNYTEAQAKGWEAMARPTKATTSGFDALELWADPSDCTIAILVDECGQTSGLQLAIPADGLVTYYDKTKQGLTNWVVTNSTDGSTTEYWTINQYFVSEDEETRKASCNASLVFRANNMVVEGLNGELVEIPVNLDNLDPIWTEQACVPLMGRHYYYNMTTSLSCDDPFTPWFPIYDSNTKQLISAGFMALGSTTSTKCENPSRAAVAYIVPYAPDCLLELVANYGAITLHLYYVDNPLIIFC